MTFLLDANVLLRLNDPTAQEHPSLQGVIRRETFEGNEPVLAPQVVFETWTVLTRESKYNGFGYAPAEASKMLHEVLKSYSCQGDPPGLLHHWLKLCETYEVRGRQGHDCRLVAWMELNGIKHLLTLNSADFARYAQVEVLSLGL